MCAESCVLCVCSKTKLVLFSADVGGTFGLFLGCSLLTVLEIAEFMMLNVVLICKECAGLRNHKNVENVDEIGIKYGKEDSFEILRNKNSPASQ